MPRISNFSRSHFLRFRAAIESNGIKPTIGWIPVQGTWRVPPCRRTVATQPVSPLRVLSANFPPCFPSLHLLLDLYNPIDVALHERDASTRISPSLPWLPLCVFTSLRRGRDERHNSLRQNYPTYVRLSSSFSFHFFHPLFLSLSFFFFLGDFYRSILLEVKGLKGWSWYFFFFL